MKEFERKKIIKAAIVGASFTTGNLGVSALSESSIICILNRWPDAEVYILGGDRTSCVMNINVDGRTVQIKNIPVRFSKNIFLPNHLFVYFFYAFMRFIIPSKKIQDYFINKNPYVKEIVDTDVVLDISGGDSFSDIYGMWRFYSGFLPKWMILLYRKPLIFLPQTYGPYNKKITRLLARFLISKAKIVYSRDRYSCLILQKLFGSDSSLIEKKMFHVPDVAFILPSLPPAKLTIQENFKKLTSDSIIGLNVSGLLYHGGYTQNNMFGLKVDYRELVASIIDFFMKIQHAKIILVPHVMSDLSDNLTEADLEDDYVVCREIHKKSISKYPGRIFLAHGNYNQNELKYIIGMSDLFLGSRMHSCIAALSQCIPAVGIAYSRKFEGVFASIGVENCVVDMRNETPAEIINKISKIYAGRKDISTYLNRVMPDVKHKVINLLNNIEI